ncbi:hypothetical protein JQ596_09765 [Bradyrhizobium manausense]|uniref:hypothetical protein n=1 Tax=Bradyrhizobium TaxID=374 RepID=UPI001BA5A40A|nr:MULTISPECIES: hypothetical protein [Bradyrhizobium]MBR0825823.1 hypothetical protein [Bradyrhizobium manausense]UVO31236.1 hypothetical protein KUF59_11585 [Bradyrhizobium arachidis]
MGAFVPDGYVPHVQDQINSRFAVGDAIKEMAGFQKEFKLFSLEHSLISAFTLLNIAPVGEKDREGFLKYLEMLKKTGAQVDGQQTKYTGHDQIIVSLKGNLESKSPLPVYFTWHPGEKPKGQVLVVSRDQAFIFSSTNYLTISVPTVKPKGKKKY